MLAAGAGAVIAVFTGIVSAIVVAFGVAFAVIWLTNLLQQ